MKFSVTYSSDELVFVQVKEVHLSSKNTGITLDRKISSFCDFVDHKEMGVRQAIFH